MKSDIFILIPCHVEDSYSHLKNICDKFKDSFADEYMSTLRDAAQSELVDRVYNIFDRCYLGEYTFPILGDALKGKEEIEKTKIKLFITFCERTRLSVITGIITGYQGNPTNILDQVTREEILFDFGTHYTYINSFLINNFKIFKNGEAKTCVIQTSKASEEDILYYMANETNDSKLVDTKIISEKYKSIAVDNVAVYDFSEIYVSESTIYQSLTVENEDKLQYECLLIFIVELIVMQLSAVYRTNVKVALALEENKTLNVKDYEKLSNEFANTLSIWQVNIYRYKGAQTIANTISRRFEVNKVLANYKQNDRFLQNIINTRNVKNALKESNILFYVAILLFIKEFYLFVKSIFLYISGNYEIGVGDVLGLSTSAVVLIVVLMFYHGRIRKINDKNR